MGPGEGAAAASVGFPGPHGAAAAARPAVTVLCPDLLDIAAHEGFGLLRVKPGTCACVRVYSCL